MQNTTLSDNTSPENSNSYSPSVPISLYREVTAELQAAQAMLDSLKTHNQQLVQQNQQLRREVETVVQVSQQLQQVVNSAQSVTQTGIPQMPSVKFNFSSVEPPPPAPATSRTNSSVPQPPQTVAFPSPYRNRNRNPQHLRYRSHFQKNYLQRCRRFLTACALNPKKTQT